MRRIITCLLFVSLAGACFAPINLREKPSNYKELPEATEAQLQKQQQQYAGVAPVVGQVEEKTTPDYEGKITSDPGAAKAVASATVEGKTASGAPAASNGTSMVRMLINGALFLLIGFAVVFGFRMWADRSIPVPDKIKT